MIPHPQPTLTQPATVECLFFGIAMSFTCLSQGLLLLLVLLTIVVTNIMVAPLRSRALGVLESLSYITLCMTVGLSLYFVDTGGVTLDEVSRLVTYDGLSPTHVVRVGGAQHCCVGNIVS